MDDIELLIDCYSLINNIYLILFLNCLHFLWFLNNNNQQDYFTVFCMLLNR